MLLSSRAIAPLGNAGKDPLDGPAMRPPPGVTPIYTTTSPEQVKAFALRTVFTTIAGLFFLLRMYTTIRIIHKIDLTDCLTILVFILYMIMVAFGRVIIEHGGGVHQWNVTLRELKDILFWMYINESMYPVCIVLIKVTILLQYLHILAPNRTVNRTLWYGAWIIITANILFYVPIFFINVWMCSPREKIWNPILQKQSVGHCLNQRAVVTAVGIFNIVSDITILILPTRSVWSLRIPTYKKAKISALFATGAMACGADIALVYFLFRMTSHDGDASYYAPWMGTSGMIEISLGIIVSCSMSIPRFFESKGQEVLRTVSRPFTLLRDFRSNTTTASEVKTNSSSVVVSECYPKRSNSVTKQQTPSERNLTFDVELYGQQIDEMVTASSVYIREDIREHTRNVDIV